MKLKRCRLTEKQQGRLLEFFVGEMTARTAADLAGINKTTAAYFYHRLREISPGGWTRPRPWPARSRPTRVTSAASERANAVVAPPARFRSVGILKRGGRVYTKDPRCQLGDLIPIINRMIRPDSIVYTDTWASYNALDISDFHHLRINHSKLFADRDNHINGIENFWNQAKRHF